MKPCVAQPLRGSRRVAASLMGAGSRGTARAPRRTRRGTARSRSSTSRPLDARSALRRPARRPSRTRDRRRSRRRARDPPRAGAGAATARGDGRWPDDLREDRERDLAAGCARRDRARPGVTASSAAASAPPAATSVAHAPRRDARSRRARRSGTPCARTVARAPPRRSGPATRRRPRGSRAPTRGRPRAGLERRRARAPARVASLEVARSSRFDDAHDVVVEAARSAARATPRPASCRRPRPCGAPGRTARCTRPSAPFEHSTSSARRRARRLDAPASPPSGRIETSRGGARRDRVERLLRTISREHAPPTKPSMRPSANTIARSPRCADHRRPGERRRWPRRTSRPRGAGPRRARRTRRCSARVSPRRRPAA